MTKKAKEPTVDNVTVLPVQAELKPVPSPAIAERLSEGDVKNLELAKLTRQLALKEAEKALAENNAAEMSYKYLILQLYMKYGLTASDALDEKGNILRGAVLPKSQ